jgi:serine/threonine protein phosphatase PrpC
MDLITPREPAPPSYSDGPRREPSVVAEHAVFAVRSSKLEIAVASGCSRRRAVNEDAHSPLDGPSAIYVVADGVGGGAMAAWASRELVRRLHAALDRRDVDAAAIGAALLAADLELRREIARETASAGAATVALCASNGQSLAHWLIAWVGDCRVYRARVAASGAAELLTRDDTYEHLGELPPPGGSPHDPARMVGNGAVVTPNVESVHLRDGEMLVLCSDGLHKNVDAREIGRVLQSHAPPSRGCERLLEIARSRSGDDDATVLVVHRKARDGFSGMAQQ